jgi:hypothetical protein
VRDGVKISLRGDLQFFFRTTSGKKIPTYFLYIARGQKVLYKQGIRMAIGDVPIY